MTNFQITWTFSISGTEKHLELEQMLISLQQRTLVGPSALVSEPLPGQSDLISKR